MVKYIAPAPEMVVSMPTSVVEYIAPAPVVEFFALVPEVKNIAPAPVVEHTAPVPVVEYITPTSGGTHHASASGGARSASASRGGAPHQLLPLSSASGGELYTCSHGGSITNTSCVVCCFSSRVITATSVELHRFNSCDVCRAMHQWQSTQHSAQVALSHLERSRPVQCTCALTVASDPARGVCLSGEVEVGQGADVSWVRRVPMPERARRRRFVRVLFSIGRDSRPFPFPTTRLCRE